MGWGGSGGGRWLKHHKELFIIGSGPSLKCRMEQIGPEQKTIAREMDYRIAGKFGGGKVWRIWRIVRDSSN